MKSDDFEARAHVEEGDGGGRARLWRGRGRESHPQARFLDPSARRLGSRRKSAGAPRGRNSRDPCGSRSAAAPRCSLGRPRVHKPKYLPSNAVLKVQGLSPRGRPRRPLRGSRRRTSQKCLVSRGRFNGWIGRLRLEGRGDEGVGRRDGARTCRAPQPGSPMDHVGLDVLRGDEWRIRCHPTSRNRQQSG